MVKTSLRALNINIKISINITEYRSSGEHLISSYYGFCVLDTRMNWPFAKKPTANKVYDKGVFTWQ